MNLQPSRAPQFSSNCNPSPLQASNFRLLIAAVSKHSLKTSERIHESYKMSIIKPVTNKNNVYYYHHHVCIKTYYATANAGCVISSLQCPQCQVPGPPGHSRGVPFWPWQVYPHKPRLGSITQMLYTDLWGLVLN